MGVVKTVVSQALCVAKTLEDGVHKTLARERDKGEKIFKLGWLLIKWMNYKINNLIKYKSLFIYF